VKEKKKKKDPAEDTAPTEILLKKPKPTSHHQTHRKIKNEKIVQDLLYLLGVLLYLFPADHSGSSFSSSQPR